MNKTFARSRLKKYLWFNNNELFFVFTFLLYLNLLNKNVSKMYSNEGIIVKMFKGLKYFYMNL